jgi:hypothetical protein
MAPRAPRRAFRLFNFKMVASCHPCEGLNVIDEILARLFGTLGELMRLDIDRICRVPLAPSSLPESLSMMLEDSGARLVFLYGTVSGALSPVRAKRVLLDAGAAR